MNLKIYTYALLLLTLVVGFALYAISGDVHLLNKNINNLESKIEKRKHDIAVLRAEFYALSSAERIEILSKKYLPELKAPKSIQIISDVSKIDKKFTPNVEKSKKKEQNKIIKANTKSKAKFNEKQVKKSTPPIITIEDLIKKTLIEDKTSIVLNKN